jgi:hypothetical protein
MSDKSEQPQEPAQSPPAEHQTGYTGHEYPWMSDAKGYKADHSPRHTPPMLRRKKGAKR